MIRGIIFDLDNTLYDYDLCDKMAQEALERWCCRNLHMEKMQVQDYYNRAKEIVKGRLGNVGASHNRMLYMQNFLELIGKPPVLYAMEMYDIYWDTMLEEMKSFEYVVPLFRWLKERNIKIGILTDLTAHIQHRKIKALQLAEYVDILVSSEEAGREKPDVCMFDLMLKKMQAVPRELLMVGDSLLKDVQGAEAAGMGALLFQKEEAAKFGQYVALEIERLACVHTAEA